MYSMELYKLLQKSSLFIIYLKGEVNTHIKMKIFLYHFILIQSCDNWTSMDFYFIH